MLQDATDTHFFDAIGDVHGCYYELISLVDKLGYEKDENDGLYRHPDGRMLVFLGDITDRGWYNSMSFQFVLQHWEAGLALWCRGNHDHHLFQWLRGDPVRVSDGLSSTINELEQGWPFSREKSDLGQYLLKNVPTKIELDDGDVVAVHAYHDSDKLKDHIYGLRSGPNNSRVEWWTDYEGPPYVVFGHYWLDDPAPKNWHCCLDTSCCRNGSLSAIRWPEMKVVQVETQTGYS